MIDIISANSKPQKTGYASVRACPVKAIRLSSSTAEVLSGRCIYCGNCLRANGHDAYTVHSSLDEVQALLESGRKVAAILDPSYPVEFQDSSPDELAEMMCATGFTLAGNASFAVDIIGAAYAELLTQHPDRLLISSACPVTVAVVEKYYSELIPLLAPVVSPLIASARWMKSHFGQDLKVVYIGPCVGRQAEILRPEFEGEVAAVLTFRELRELMLRMKISTKMVSGTHFVTPGPVMGDAFPLERGLIRAIGLDDNPINSKAISANGSEAFFGALDDVLEGKISSGFLEIMYCRGCYLGNGFSDTESGFTRRFKFSAYQQLHGKKDTNPVLPQTEFNAIRNILDTRFKPDDQRIADPSESSIAEVMGRMQCTDDTLDMDCGACGYTTCRSHAVAIIKGLSEVELCLPFANSQLKKTLKNLQDSTEKLSATQELFYHSEKLANLAQLSTAMVCKLNNPLSVVMLYSHLLWEDSQISCPAVRDDLKVLVDKADECKKILMDLLNLARKNKILLEPVDVRDLVDRTMMIQPAPDQIQVKIQHEGELHTAELDKEQIVHVLSHLISNAYEAMPNGGELRISTSGDTDRVQFDIEDTGSGIRSYHLSNIFDPFFTTKKIGVGSGLGLAVTDRIVKLHNGVIRVVSNSEPSKGSLGTTFTVILPRNPREVLQQGELI